MPGLKATFGGQKGGDCSGANGRGVVRNRRGLEGAKGGGVRNFFCV